MTNQANELYQLCREVYEKAGWKDTKEHIFDINAWPFVEETSDYHVLPPDMYPKKFLVAPLYTSDYLLEKLPAHFYGGTIAMTAETDDGPTRYSFFYEDNYETAKVVHCKNVRLQGWDDTPLKALLKLTIALSEAGELNDQSN